MDDLATIFSLNNWPGHLSYVLIAISYWLTDMFWLRLVAIVGLSFEILYFWLAGGDLRAGIGWDVVFISINAYQLYRLIQDRLYLRLPEAERAEAVRSAVRRGEQVARGALRAIGPDERQALRVRFCQSPESEVSHGPGW